MSVFYNDTMRPHLFPQKNTFQSIVSHGRSGLSRFWNSLYDLNFLILTVPDFRGKIIHIIVKVENCFLGRLEMDILMELNMEKVMKKEISFQCIIIHTDQL